MDLHQRIVSFRQRYQDAPDSRVFAPLADLLRQDGQVDAAIEMLEEGLVQHPGYLTAMVILGHCLLESGRNTAAAEILESVLDRDPGNLVAQGLLAQEARQREDWALAAIRLEKLVTADPDEPTWKAYLQDVQDQTLRDQSKPSETILVEGVPVPADGSFATLTMVDILLEQGYRSRAVKALEKMLDRQPQRQDVRDRLQDLLGRDLDVDEEIPLTVNGSHDPSFAEHRHRLSQRRRVDKKQFEDWLNNCSDQTGAEQ